MERTHPPLQPERCDLCCRIDIRKTLLQEPSTLNSSKTSFGSVKSEASSLSPGCAFCKVVFDSWAKSWYNFATKNFLNTYRGFRHEAYERDPKRYFKYCSTCFEVDDRLFFFPDTKAGLLAPRRISSSFDPVFAMKWLAKCKSFHPQTCIPPSIGFPDRVIDCSTRTVTSGFAGIQYIALSYVWGLKANALKRKFGLGTTGSLSHRLPDKLPQTIEDAIQLTSMIGYRYIWIDMYCIDQSDMDDKHRQVAHMDVVYACAEATIIVAAGEDCYSGIPGVGKTPRKVQESITIDGVNLCSFGNSVGKEVRDSKWWTRAWTFQEGLLSHRRLVFTESQTFFECNAITSAEAIGGLELVRTRSELRVYKEIFDNGVFRSLITKQKPFRGFFDGAEAEVIYSPPDCDSAINRFQTLVRIYTAKSLSYDSDTLNAFNAIGMSFSRPQQHSAVSPNNPNAVLNLSGVPFTLNHEDRQKSLTNGLLWSYDGYSTPIRRRRDFPTWAWAGFEGVVDWTLWIETPHWHIDSVETAGGLFCDVMELENLVNMREYKTGTLQVQGVYVNAPVVKPEMWQEIRHVDGQFRSRPGSSWGGIFSSPIQHGFANASRDLLPQLRSGQWYAFCAGSSRLKGTMVLYLVERHSNGDAIRVGLAEMRYGWALSEGQEAERENYGLRQWLEQATVRQLVKLI
ncbi:HET-domain-containing protein [Xylariaceae sp. AK1471]|nr:HET-domain-containing protein [Xylariaceae sp. AK1471]